MRQQRQAGYSLVELLIVLALLGLISIAIAGGVSFGNRAWEHTERKIHDTAVAIGGHQLLRALLTAAYPRQTGEPGEEPFVAFEGAHDRLTFLSAASDAIGERGIVELALTVERTGGEASLHLKIQSVANGERKEILLAGAREIVIAYAEAAEGTVVWTDAWQARRSLPLLIRVRATFADGTRRWPDLVVMPRVNRAAPCMFDPVSFECRRG